MKHNYQLDKRIKIKITHTEIQNSFLKIKAQYVKTDEFNHLLDLKSIYKCVNPMTEDDIKLGDNIYIARLDFDSYLRCRITEINDFRQICTIDLIDAGFKIKINYSQLRILPKSSSIYHVLPIVKEFILAELIISRDCDNFLQKFTKFNELVLNRFFDMELLSENNAGKYIQIYSLEASLAHDIIPNHPTLKTILKRINLAEQMSLMLEQFLNESSPSSSQSLPNFSDSKNPTDYISQDVFQMGTKHEVRISAYENGPQLFYVQPTQALQEYQDFHVNLQKSLLAPLKSPPKVSDLCLAFLESNDVQRAQVIETATNHFYKLRLIDNGTERMLNLKDLFEITDDLLVQKPFAWKFCLHQINMLSTNAAELNFYFQYITKDKRLSLTAKPQKNESICACTLHDGMRSIFESLKAYNPRSLRYPSKTPLLNAQKVKIVYADSPKSFFINLCDSSPEQQAVFEEFSKFTSCIYRNPLASSACYVKINDKNVRGRFEKKITSSICQVKLIDIGIVDDFSCNELKIMIDKFTKIPPLAYKCCLVDFKDTACDKKCTKAFIALCKRFQTFNLKIDSVEGDTYYVRMEDEKGENIVDSLDIGDNEIIVETCETTNDVQETLQLENSLLNVVDLQASESFMSLGDWTEQERREWGEKNFWDDTNEVNYDDFNCKGTVTSIVSPKDFTIQCLDTMEKLKSFLNDLEKSVPDLCPLTGFAFGTRCVAKNPFTGLWCRGILMDASLDNLLVTIRDIDNGQIFSVEDLNDLKQPTIFTFMNPPFGIQCGLPIKIKELHDDEATRIFCEFVNNREICYKIIACNKFSNICEILYEKRNVSDYLIQLELATKLKFIKNGPGHVVYVKNLKEFYVQPKIQSEILNNLEKFSREYEQLCLRAPVVGLFVMSKSKEFGNWYRAEIIEIGDLGILVKYLDYGNAEWQKKSDLGMINDPWIMQTPPICQRCSLNLPKDIDPNSPEAIKRFNEISQRGYKEVHVRMIEPQLNKCIVEVYIEEEKKIIDELLPLCQKINIDADQDADGSSIDSTIESL